MGSWGKKTGHNQDCLKQIRTAAFQTLYIFQLNMLLALLLKVWTVFAWLNTCMKGTLKLSKIKKYVHWFSSVSSTVLVLRLQVLMRTSAFDDQKKIYIYQCSAAKRKRKVTQIHFKYCSSFLQVLLPYWISTHK